MAFNRDNFNNVSSGSGSQMKIWTYTNTSDTLATIKAADYFNDMRFALNTNDMIYVVGSDGIAQLAVTSVRNASSVTTNLYSGAGSVDVADIANGTAGELITWDAAGSPTTVSTGTSGQILTSNGAGAAPTFQAAAGGGLYTEVKVNLTDAQVQNLNSTAVQLLASPGANNILEVNSIQVINPNGSGFSGGGDFQFGYTSSIFCKPFSDLASSVATSPVAYGKAGPIGSAFQLGAVSNQGFYVKNATAAFTGSPGSGLDFYLVYRVVSTT